MDFLKIIVVDDDDDNDDDDDDDDENDDKRQGWSVFVSMKLTTSLVLPGSK